MRGETRWAPGFEPEKPKKLPRGIRRPKFQSREDVVRYCETRALMVERDQLEPKKVRSLVAFANLALQAWALELAGKSAGTMQPLAIQMIDYRSLLPRSPTTPVNDVNGVPAVTSPAPW